MKNCWSIGGESEHDKSVTDIMKHLQEEDIESIRRNILGLDKQDITFQT